MDSQSSVFECGGIFHETHANMGTISYASNGDIRWGPLEYSGQPNAGYDQARALSIERDHTGKAEFVYVTGFVQPTGIDFDYGTLRYAGTNASTHDWAVTYNGLGGSSVDFAWDIGRRFGRTLRAPLRLRSANLPFALIPLESEMPWRHRR